MTISATTKGLHVSVYTKFQTSILYYIIVVSVCLSVRMLFPRISKTMAPRSINSVFRLLLVTTVSRNSILGGVFIFEYLRPYSYGILVFLGKKRNFSRSKKFEGCFFFDFFVVVLFFVPFPLKHKKRLFSRTFWT